MHSKYFLLHLIINFTKKNIEMSKTIKFKYLFQDDYNPKYVNGAQGGISPRGEIIINFYFERNGLPHSQTLEFDENGKSSEIIESLPNDLESSFLRVVENGVVMSYQTAKEIHNWLGKHIEKLEEINAKED